MAVRRCSSDRTFIWLLTVWQNTPKFSLHKLLTVILLCRAVSRTCHAYPFLQYLQKKHAQYYSVIRHETVRVHGFQAFFQFPHQCPEIQILMWHECKGIYPFQVSLSLLLSAGVEGTSEERGNSLIINYNPSECFNMLCNYKHLITSSINTIWVHQLSYVPYVSYKGLIHILLFLFKKEMWSGVTSYMCLADHHLFCSVCFPGIL